MDLLRTNSWPRAKSCTLHLHIAFRFLGNSGSEFRSPRKLVELLKMNTGNVENVTFLNYPFLESVIDRGLSCSNGTLLKISTRLCCTKFSSAPLNLLLRTLCTRRSGSNTSDLATRIRSRSIQEKKKLKKRTRICFPLSKYQTKTLAQTVRTSSGTAYIQDENKIFSSNTTKIETSVIVPSRNDVLLACTVTCGLEGALGVLIRQISHFASGEGWPLNDCSANITFGFELWHLELVVGSILLLSSTRFLLLKIWPDFAKSNETANQLVLTSLKPLDYLVVAFLPGIRTTFRGALSPLFVINWTSILVVAALFGILHLGGGGNYSFAIWATFVGLVYGYATILTSSATVPMASHALNNLVGVIIRRYQRGLVNESG